MSRKTVNKVKSGIVGIVFVIFVVSLFAYFILVEVMDFGKDLLKPDKSLVTKDSMVDDSSGFTEGFMKAVIDTNRDTNLRVITMSSSGSNDVPYLLDENAGFNFKKVFTGRRINIAVTGVDSRLGSNYKHADANHILSILIDAGKIEIFSIPRDTPSDAGFDDTTGQNKLTVVRGAKGRTAYLTEMARIAGLDKIHYYVEFGFSQAIGILEWLGYGESGSTLQVLRSRTGLGGDDFQRTYNQAQFMRQMILTRFGKISGFWGDLLIKGGLTMTETNISSHTASEILEKLKAAGFPSSPEDITISIKPALRIKYKVFDFTDKNVIAQLKNKIERYNISKSDSNDVRNVNISNNVHSLLSRSINSAVADSAKRPAQVISKLKTYFNQRAWLQISDSANRSKVREQFGILLYDAYLKKGKTGDAKNIRDVIEAEKLLFSHKIKPEKLSHPKNDTSNISVKQ